MPKTGKPLPPPGESKPTSWAARYGRVILAHGVATIPTALYYYQARLGLSAQEVWFTSYILAHKWTAALPTPSLKRMAEHTAMSVSQLQRIRARLCAKRLLLVHEHYNTIGGQTANSYDFAPLFSRLEAALMAEPPADNGIQVLDLAAPDPDEDPADNSFAARYGRVIARAGITALPQALFTHQATLQLTPQQVWFIGYILAHRWTTALPHPSLVRMAERTGYSQRQLHNIKDELVAHGYLRLVPRRGVGGGTDTNGYDFSSLLDTLSQHLKREEPPPPAPAPDPFPPLPELSPRRGRRAPAPASADQPQATLFPTPTTRRAAAKSGTAQTSNGRTALSSYQEIAPGSYQGIASNSYQGTADGSLSQTAHSSYGGAAFSSLGRTADSSYSQVASSTYAGPQELHISLASSADRGVAGTTQAGAAPSSDKEEPDHQEPIREDDDSNHQRSRQKEHTHRPPYSAYIAEVVFDFSRELGDEPHVAANVTQALRLYANVTLGEQAFVAQLYEARRLTRQYQGRQGAGSIDNKMAYFFRVLRDVLAADPPHA